MPLSSIASAIVSSIITNAIEAPSAPVAPIHAALERHFPEGTETGLLAGAPDMMGNVRINDKILPASPGLQIRDEMNLIVFPSMIGNDVPIRYQLDPVGTVWRIWVMSPAEVAAFNP